jgi:hypothetical protein
MTLRPLVAQSYWSSTGRCFDIGNAVRGVGAIQRAIPLRAATIRVPPETVH